MEYNLPWPPSLPVGSWVTGGVIATIVTPGSWAPYPGYWRPTLTHTRTLYGDTGVSSPCRHLGQIPQSILNFIPALLAVWKVCNFVAIFHSSADNITIVVICVDGHHSLSDLYFIHRAAGVHNRSIVFALFCLNVTVGCSVTKLTSLWLRRWRLITLTGFCDLYCTGHPLPRS